MAVMGMATGSRPLGYREIVVQLHRLLQNSAFEPEAIKAMASAFEGACRVLGLADTDPLRETVAKKIIELAQQGEGDSDRLRERTLEHFRAT
jgi:hypothetical protein